MRRKWKWCHLRLWRWCTDYQLRIDGRGHTDFGFSSGAQVLERSMGAACTQRPDSYVQFALKPGHQYAFMPDLRHNDQWRRVVGDEPDRNLGCWRHLAGELHCSQCDLSLWNRH